MNDARADAARRAPRALAIVAVVVLAACGRLAAQDGGTPDSLGIPAVDTLVLSGTDTLATGRPFLLAGSVRIETDSGVPLRDSTHFTVDGRDGRIVLTPAGRDTIRALGARRVVVRFRALPFTFPSMFRRRTLVARRDTARGDTIRVAAPAAPLTVESIFGSGLTHSGYIGRGFTVGTNRDLGITSGFRLQLNGKLAENVDITAALTDENSPIQPEGTTRTLQELDKVFIRIAGPRVAGTFGDFTLAYPGTEFGRYTRKLSGILGEATLGGGSVTASYATMKGIFHSVRISGIDGVQGPYRLTGRNGEQRILVLAGTERVYVDGVRMTRGEQDDYTIEYASGEITFTPHRLITSFSRITVDFEYAEGNYPRSLVTAGGTATLFDGALSVTARGMRESDDETSPINVTLDDADRRTLAAAGNDQSKASTDGVRYVGIDTTRGTGAGQYVRVDTLVGGVSTVVYRYAPGADSATYAVTFSFVGAGHGDYRRQTIGIFAYAGPNGGDYAPIRLLPLPQVLESGTLLAVVRPLHGLEIGAEVGLSSFDANRFSTLDAADNNGSASNLSLRWSGKTSAGAFDFASHLRTTDAHFTPMDRIDNVEFDRTWAFTDTVSARETIREASLAWRPDARWRASAGVGSLSRSAFFSTRVDGGLTLAHAPDGADGASMDYGFEYIASDDGSAAIRGRWLRQHGEAAYATPIATPRFRLEAEHRTTTAGATDTLAGESLAFLDLRPGVRVAEFAHMTFDADVGVRLDDAPSGGALVRRSRDFLQQYAWTLRTWNDLGASAVVTIRDRRYEQAFRDAGDKDLQTVLTKAQARYTPLRQALAADLLYEVSTERTSRLERIFLPVPFGQGNYTYKGDLNNNGVQDEDEFEPTRFDGDYILTTLPTDQLFPVVDLRTSARLRISPSRILDAAAGGWLTGVLRAISTESTARVEEKSSDERTSDVYLLRFRTFLDDSTTIRGFQNLRQDVFLFEQNREFSVRLRFDQSRGFNQYALGNERSYRRERSVRVNTQLVREIGLQTDFATLDDRLATPAATNRARSIVSTAFANDLSYRPWPRVEIGAAVSTKHAVDSWPDVPVIADITTVSLRTVFTVEGPGRVRIEAEHDDVGFAAPVETFPYELTDGKAAGSSWIVRANVDYRITHFLQATFSYLGRAEGGSPMLHTARAEVRAFF